MMRIHNYVQVTGLQQGDNILTLQLDRVEESGIVDQITILPGSKILYGLVAPPNLQLEVSEEALGTVGQPIHIPYRIISTGYPVRSVGYRVGTNSEDFIVSDMPAGHFGWVAGSERSLTILALTAGTHRIRIDVSGETGGSDSRVVTVHVKGG